MILNKPVPDTEGWSIRRLGPADLGAYKALRDEGLARNPDAFASDVETEHAFSPESYIVRLGLHDPLGGTFLLGAFTGDTLIGAVSLEREALQKQRHIAVLSTMAVRPEHGGQGLGGLLLRTCLEQARRAAGLEMVTLSVSASSERAVRLYERTGFKRYGLLPRAIRIAGAQGVRYYDKVLMAINLQSNV